VKDSARIVSGRATDDRGHRHRRLAARIGHPFLVCTKCVMSPIRGVSPLSYRRLGHAEFGVVEALELDPDQVERFLGPVADILTATRRGLAHSMFAIETSGALVGFYVIHPDPRDASCWWLGWFAIDRRQQGHGYGSLAMLAVLSRLEHLGTCRRVRLLVALDNVRARGLYDRAGFRPLSRSTGTGEIVLELALRPAVATDGLEAFILDAVVARAKRVFCHRRLRLSAGPHAAWVIGVERGPPTRARRPIPTPTRPSRPIRRTPGRRPLPRRPHARAMLASHVTTSAA